MMTFRSPEKYLFLLFTILLSVKQSYAQFDSVQLVHRQLESIVDETSMIALRIKTPVDKRQYGSDLQVLQDRVNSIKTSFPQMFDYPELVAEYRHYIDIVNGIDVFLEKAGRLHKIDSLRIVLDCWIPRFDSLLAVGEDYAEHKYGDSVRFIKSKADEWESRVDAIKQMNDELVKNDEELQQRFFRIAQTYDEIKDLSEKERVRIKNILLYGGIIAGATAFAGSFFSNQIRSRKMMKNAEKAMKEAEKISKINNA